MVSVYFPHSGNADQHVEKVYKSIEKMTKSSKKHDMQIVGGDFNAELGPSAGIEHLSVGRHTLNESNRRGDWLKQWLMLQKFVALNTMYKKHVRNKLHTGHLKVQRSSWTTSW